MPIRFLDHCVTDGTTKARVHYSLDGGNPKDGPCVTVFARDYSRKLGIIFGSEYKDLTEMQTDYYDEGSVTFHVGHPHYAAARAAAELARTRRAAQIARRNAKREARRQTWRLIKAAAPLVGRCGPDCDAMMQHTAECMAARL